MGGNALNWSVTITKILIGLAFLWLVFVIVVLILFYLYPFS
jgi:hypothetical protein